MVNCLIFIFLLPDHRFFGSCRRKKYLQKLGHQLIRQHHRERQWQYGRKRSAPSCTAVLIVKATNLVSLMPIAY